MPLPFLGTFGFSCTWSSDILRWVFFEKKVFNTKILLILLSVLGFPIFEAPNEMRHRTHASVLMFEAGLGWNLTVLVGVAAVVIMMVPAGGGAGGGGGGGGGLVVLC